MYSLTTSRSERERALSRLLSPDELLSFVAVMHIFMPTVMRNLQKVLQSQPQPRSRTSAKS
jgi:energy-coupling factor transporter transmembrane protein EcfT